MATKKFGNIRALNSKKVQARYYLPTGEQVTAGIPHRRTAGTLSGYSPAGNRDLEKELNRIGRGDLSADYAGWGTHLKPAFEPITLARNLAPRQSIVETLAETGAGGLNLDATAVPAGTENLARVAGQVSGRASWAIGGRMNPTVPRMEGRMPGNVLLEHGAQCAEVSCGGGCPVAAIDAQGRAKYAAGREPASRPFTRLRYSGRAAASERPYVDGVSAPTVKPQNVLSWLCDLLLPALVRSPRQCCEHRRMLSALNATRRTSR